MAHNINRNNGKDSIVWAGETPWHRLGTKLPEAFTAAEALQHGGLDYTVEKVGLQTVDGAKVPMLLKTNCTPPFNATSVSMSHY